MQPTAFSRAAAGAALAALMLLAVDCSQAATFYVATTGSDAGPGTLAQPWSSLQHAADQVAPGDTVFVRAGNYTGMHLTTSGSPGLRIVFAAFPGETPVVDTQNAVTTDGINLEGASHVTVRGFTVTGVPRAGIRAVLCDEVEILDNVLDQNGRWGVLTGFCDDLLIAGNQASRSAIEHGIYVSNSGDRPVIRGNHIFDNNANGIHMNGDASLGGDGIISGALVEDNVIHGNGAGGGSGINGDGLQDSLIRNNLVFDQHASGISLYQIDGGAPAHGNRVLNNTVLVAADGRWALNVQDGSQGTQVFNNVFHSAHAFRGTMSICSDCLAGMASDHNAVEDRFTLDDGDTVLTLAQWRVATGLDSSSVAGDPQGWLADPASGDFRPAAGSALLDAGTARADVPRDLVGLARPQGAGWDIGAYEAASPDAVFRDGFED